LLVAQDHADPVAAEAAAKAIEARLRLEAKTIREKYIAAPYTTDFGILFVPTEGLYAEALRRPGLVESLQREHRITLTGPTTLLATLSSLQMGFRTLALEKRSAEVWEVLGAVKGEFQKFGDVLAKTKKIEGRQPDRAGRDPHPPDGAQAQECRSDARRAGAGPARRHGGGRRRRRGRRVSVAELLPRSQLRAALPAVIGALVCVHAGMAATRVTASLLVLHHGCGMDRRCPAVAVRRGADRLSLWAGRLADRRLHRPLGVGVAMGAVGRRGVLTQHPAALAFAALATGCRRVAAVGIQREAGLMAREPSDLKRVFSWIALGPALSNALAPVVVGLLIDHVGFRSGFVFAALLPLVAWWLGRRVPPTAPAVPRNEEDSRGRPRGTLSAFGLLRSAPLRRLLLVNLALSSCWDAHSFAVPVLGHARGLSASSIGLILGAFAVAATLVRLAISRWAEHLDEKRALRRAMVLATAVCATYYWLPGVAGMVIGSALLGLALGSVQPMVLSMLHQVTPAGRHGEALGLRMVATNAATIVMPVSFGALAAATMPAAPLWLMAALVLVAQGPASRIGRPGQGPGD
jgi:MFS family permease